MAMKSRVERSSLTKRVTEAMLELISERKLGDGDPRPSTTELAATFEVSLSVVREALAGLAALGLVDRQQGRETLLSTPDSRHLGRLLGFRISNAAVDDEAVQQFREIVEVGSARLAARNRDARHLEELERALAVLQHATGDEELHDADVAFHAAVARAGGNDLFTLDVLDALEPLLRRLRSRVWNGWVASGGDRESIIDAHATVLERIGDGDEDGAGLAMTRHLGQARVGLESPPDSDSRPAAH